MKAAKKVVYDGLVYSINEKEKMASVIDYKEDIKNIFIPSSIPINSEYYLVNSIADNALRYHKAETLQFSQYSEIQYIGSNAFFEADFQTIIIPSSITNFDKYWNNGLYHLKKIEVIKTEKENIKVIDEKFLVGKTDLNSNVFDVLLFASRDITEATIPSFIKKIASQAFQHCNILNEIKISSNSQLQTICSNAFSGSDIKTLEIPSSIQDLQNLWCSGVYLKNIKIIKNGDVNIKFVRNKFLVGKSNQKSDIFDVLIYVRFKVNKAKIPAYITKIESNAFSSTNAHKVIFPKSSKLQTICECAFDCSLIEKIKIPSQVEEISKKSFERCLELKKIILANNSKLKTIGEDAFFQSIIEYIEIPSSISCLKDEWCDQTKKLKTIKIIKYNEENIKLIDNKIIIGKSDLKSDIFDVLHFACRNIEEIKIPSYIKKIASCAFDECEMLKKIEFEPNSKLKFIGNSAFSSSSIENIDFPSSLIEFGKYAFSHCEKLKRINFPKDSMFEKIGYESFFAAKIKEICIPSKVKVINKYTFTFSAIEKMTFQENSELKIIEKGGLPCSLKYFEIPSSVVKFKKNWIGGHLLNEIKVIKNGQENIKFVDNFLLGKTDLKSDVFDILYLTSRKVKNAIIPAQIKKIASKAFISCHDLIYIDFDENSELQIIEKFAFSILDIKCICIPSKVIDIMFYAFYNCKNLQIIELSGATFNANKQNLLFDINKAIFMVSN